MKNILPLALMTTAGVPADAPMLIRVPCGTVRHHCTVQFRLLSGACRKCQCEISWSSHAVYGLIHTGRPTRRKANGIYVHEWECSHCTASNIKRICVRICARASSVDWAVRVLKQRISVGNLSATRFATVLSSSVAQVPNFCKLQLCRELGFISRSRLLVARQKDKESYQFTFDDLYHVFDHFGGRSQHPTESSHSIGFERRTTDLKGNNVS